MLGGSPLGRGVLFFVSVPERSAKPQSLDTVH